MEIDKTQPQFSKKKKNCKRETQLNAEIGGTEKLWTWLGLKYSNVSLVLTESWHNLDLCWTWSEWSWLHTTLEIKKYTVKMQKFDNQKESIVICIHS